MEFVIAVDGSAASGKGTLAARLAADHGLPYLDTGLLYRLVGRGVLATGGDPGDADQAAAVARALHPDALARAADDAELRTGEAGEAASRVAAHPPVRAALLDLQRAFAAQRGGAVLDGRDIGTVIAPLAPAKLFVDAALAVRAHRRWLQLRSRGDAPTLEALEADLRQRDARDAERASAPMKRAPDAVLLDTTDLGIVEAVEAARRIVETARARWESSSR